MPGLWQKECPTCGKPLGESHETAALGKRGVLDGWVLVPLLVSALSAEVRAEPILEINCTKTVPPMASPIPVANGKLACQILLSHAATLAWTPHGVESADPS